MRPLKSFWNYHSKYMMFPLWNMSFKWVNIEEAFTDKDNENDHEKLPIKNLQLRKIESGKKQSLN